MHEWPKLTSDQSIVDCAAHYHIDFIDTVYPLQHTVTNQITFSETEQQIINSEILKWFEKGLGGAVFLRPKKDGNYRKLFATLRKLGHLCFDYIDDTYLQRDTITECANTIDATLALFQKVEFIIQPDKSVLQPVQWLVFLVFILDSLLMIAGLTPEKATKIKDMSLKFF